ncbi:MAG: hypothetical protein CEE38_22860 [Planctomycetes bacterium B3_Pla]|nr:MAG: hypothetical protein CEE38_22860 [Planctomycetes bacterium B3_Pla]
MCASVLLMTGSWAAAPARSASIPIDNASFEAPVVDPNGFGAVPFVDSWTEIDVDTVAGTNTGVFANTAADSPDHVVNADGSQLAFLGSQTGNALEQDLAATYNTGCDYRLSVAVGFSGLFPPSTLEPLDRLELVLYYRDANDVVDIARQTVDATGLSATELTDISLYLPTVQPSDAWAGMAIGVALRAAGMPGGFWDMDNVRLVESLPVSIPIENASFEAPLIDPNGFPAVPFVGSWTEIDVDTVAGTNTGVFANTAAGSPDHVVNADGSQLAFLGSQTGNALEQDLAATYNAGCDYRLSVAVGFSGLFPPSTLEPLDKLELVLYYRDANDMVDIAQQTVDATNLSATELTDISLYLPTVQPGDAWAGMAIGVALRAAGMPGGFWDMDNVRLVESLPVSIPIENASFESPVVDPNINPYGAEPDVNQWTEIDPDPFSRNTGVFRNTPQGSKDHIINADGNQLAFLASVLGNALEQDLNAVYKTGCDYRLTVAVCVSGDPYQPSDPIELSLYYRDANNPNLSIDIVSLTVGTTGISSTKLQDFSVHLPTVNPDDTWAGQNIGIAIRATGIPFEAGGFWDLDNVRLAESLPDPEIALTIKE